MISAVFKNSLLLLFVLFEVSSRNIYLWAPLISNLCCKCLKLRRYLFIFHIDELCYAFIIVFRVSNCGEC